MIYSFGECSINIDTHQLMVSGHAVELELRQFQLLQILAQANSMVVSREQLMEQLWPQQVVSDSSLSRLISDTRKLIGDDGKSQHIIRTCRGGGFMLVLVVINDKQAHQNYLEKRSLLIGSVLVTVLAVLLYFSIGKTASESNEYQLVLKIQHHLDNSKTAFWAQVKRRNELGEMLGVTREGVRVFWEKEFSASYLTLAPKQRFVFDQIRGITQGAIYPANQQIADILTEHPQLKQHIASFGPLANHLNYWLAKYKQVFIKRQDMCLLYVGVEDGVPFPKTVDDDVAQWLAKHQPQ